AWTHAEENLLGKMADEELARRFNRTLESVKVHRGKLGIPVFAPKRRNWKPHEDALLGTAPDEEIARKLGRSLGVVYQRRAALGIPCRPKVKCNAWTPEQNAALGTVSDEA